MYIAIPFEGRVRTLIRSSFVLAKRLSETTYNLSGDAFQMTQVTAEQVLSGPGLARLYEYLCGRAKEPACFTQEPGFAESSCCRLFARFYGRFCRTAALSLLPQAVVVTGGVAGRTPSLVRHPEFAREFLRAKGGQRELLSRIPVWLNRHPLAGLWGAARAGVAFAGGLCRAPETC